MKAILIFVTSLDGKITRWGDPSVRKWSSVNDQRHFDSIWNSTRVIIMGSRTYSPDPVQPDDKHTFVVMTRNPENYTVQSIPGRLEFTSDLPGVLLERFRRDNEERVLIVGGSEIATLFLSKNLIDELWLTLEPKIFGAGDSFVTGEKLDVNLELIDVEKVNERGTLITKYRVVKH